MPIFSEEKQVFYDIFIFKAFLDGLTDPIHGIFLNGDWKGLEQGVISPAGARGLPAGNMEELTGNLAKNSRINVKFGRNLK